MSWPHTLYPHTAEFDLAIFRSPTSHYRGAPFWSWNCKLDQEQILRQIDVLHAMGMGGFHIHSRTGLATEYLGDDFLRLVRLCTQKAQADDMLVWLYDEDRWPSGFGGGRVTRHPEFRARHLLFTSSPYDGSHTEPFFESSARSSRVGEGTLLARYAIWLEQGYLRAYRRLSSQEEAPIDARCWFAYVETAVPAPWFNHQTYVDTLNKKATECFIATTHEQYAACVGEFFGTGIPAIFTDEPQFPHKQPFSHPTDTGDLIWPWTDDLPTSYQHIYGQNLLDVLPELFWELPDGQASLARYRYHDHICERFVSAYADTLGDWCATHGLALTGHMMEEPTLRSQTAALGEAMRSYRSFQLPGIDMLFDSHEYTTAKQAQSAAHQYARPGVTSELYGVTNWDFSFVGHKAQGDWQAALGVTVRVHHLAWVSMAGEAKRDYPASISYQSPWYQEYPLIEDHFARLNTVLTRGQALVRIGVLHPIESFWLCFGPFAQTSLEQSEREQAFQSLTHWLLFGLLDFDFIAESLLPELCPIETTVPLQVGASAYDCVLVPSMRTIRSSTLQRLESFQRHGGQVIFLGEIPSLVDALPSQRAQVLARCCQHIDFSRQNLLQALEPWREIAISLHDGGRAETILHQVRFDGNQRHIFLCNTDRVNDYKNSLVCVKGEWQLTLLDSLTGNVRPLPASVKNGSTFFHYDFFAHSSLLLQLVPARDDNNQDEEVESREWTSLFECSDPVAVTLSEPNVLLMDQAEYRLDNEPWQPLEEVLRIENSVRAQLGYPLKTDLIAQPWVDADTQNVRHEHSIRLRFTIQVISPVQAPQLALEDAALVKVSIDGQLLTSAIDGWFVDEAIQTRPLPTLAVGTHSIELEVPFGRQSNLEWCYLLGDFGVEVIGRHARVIAPVRTLDFGDWTRQGLPFYAGNVTYHCKIEGQGIEGQELAVCIPQFKAPLLSVVLDEQPAQKIAFAPFRAELGQVEPGVHMLAITVYGNRVNAFGTLHNSDETWYWFGPNAWRTTDDAWSYAYQLKSMGLLAAPRIQTSMLQPTQQKKEQRD